VEGDILMSEARVRTGPKDDYVSAAEANVDDAYRLAGYLLGDAAEAQDAVQEALVKAWRNWASLRDVAAFRPWFKRILTNVCNDRLGRRRRMVDLEAASGVEARDTFAAMLAGDEVVRAVGRLGRNQRTVVVLRFWNDMTLEQIGETLGLPLGTVKSRLHYALRAIRAELGDSFDEA
jgi:RNA polymerase sigma-70 factor (ECF subfamily)